MKFRYFCHRIASIIIKKKNYGYNLLLDLKTSFGFRGPKNAFKKKANMRSWKWICCLNKLLKAQLNGKPDKSTTEKSSCLRRQPSAKRWNGVTFDSWKGKNAPKSIIHLSFRLKYESILPSITQRKQFQHALLFEYPLCFRTMSKDSWYKFMDKNEPWK